MAKGNNRPTEKLLILCDVYRICDKHSELSMPNECKDCEGINNVRFIGGCKVYGREVMGVVSLYPDD